MRAEIADQLAAGRSPQQVRQWFVQRYGQQVLAGSGGGRAGWLLWALPALGLAALGVLGVRALRRPSRAPSSRAVTPRASRRIWDVLAAGVVAVVAAVAAVAAASPSSGPPQDPTAALLATAQSLEGQQHFAEAAEMYREAARNHPDDNGIALRLAFALLRSHQAAAAVTVAAQVLRHQPGDATALLVLGLAQRESGSPQARQTLQRFLAADPDHPAAAEVRRLLG